MQHPHRHTPTLRLLLLLLLCSCSDPVFYSSVPSFPVQLQLNIWGEYNYFVQGSGFQTLCFTERRYETDFLGYAGLLLWIDMGDQYRAADLCCPHCLDRNAPVRVDGIYAVCDKCGEEYDLSFGVANPTKGISKEMLRRYTATFSNGRLTVSP